MNKILILDTTFPINTRTERFKNTLEKKYDVYVCAWSRDKPDNKFTLSNYFIYKTGIGYGNQLKKLFYLPFFILFSVRVAYKVWPKIIFASHWDSLICAVLIKMFLLGRVKIIYDCLDVPTASHPLLKKTLTGIERINLKLVDLTIFASRHFKGLYPSNTKSIVFENYPSKKNLENKNHIPTWFNEKEFDFYLKQKNISWIGVVRYLDILKNILQSIDGTDIFLYVFGDGPDLESLKSKVMEMKLNSQVVFFGRYEAADLSFIYSISGLVWAAYPTKDFNAVYAISNKYFECSYFNKMPIISIKTKMAEGLKDNQSVILVDEYSVDDIRNKVLRARDTESFTKYEPDVVWENKEDDLLLYINDKLCS